MLSVVFVHNIMQEPTADKAITNDLTSLSDEDVKQQQFHRIDLGHGSMFESNKAECQKLTQSSKPFYSYLSPMPIQASKLSNK